MARWGSLCCGYSRLGMSGMVFNRATGRYWESLTSLSATSGLEGQGNMRALDARCVVRYDTGILHWPELRYSLTLQLRTTLFGQVTKYVSNHEYIASRVRALGHSRTHKSYFVNPQTDGTITTTYSGGTCSSKEMTISSTSAYIGIWLAARAEYAYVG